LSNSTVQRRVDGMAANIEETLCNKLKTTKFSLQIDESTLPNNESLLLGYVRYVSDECCKEELLFARKLVTNKTGVAIFHVVKKYFEEKGIQLSNITCLYNRRGTSYDRLPLWLSKFLEKCYPP
ncbi:unnamed protein product, partial [Meganyctiphanes norvegica]